MRAEDYPIAEFGAARRVPGRFGYVAFHPSPCPRDLVLDPTTVRALSSADRALGRLAGAGRLLPNPHLLVQPYLTREALASSQIEGTQASLSDVLEEDARGTPTRDPDVQEVQNYVAAFELGRTLLSELPLSLRLLRAMHGRLMTGVRGAEKSPGEFRTTQNWVGAPGSTLESARFVPPPADGPMQEALADLERFLNDPVDLPPLIVCALAHYQFETIHPFLDGNGRLGRLLVTLFLIATGELEQPLLYLSPYFERDRNAYYEHLQAVREHGRMQEWLAYFLNGVTVQAKDAVDRVDRLVDLQARYRQELSNDRSQAGAVVELLFANPFVTTRRVSQALEVTNAGANNLLRRLERLGILRELERRGQGGRLTWVAPAIFSTIAD